MMLQSVASARILLVEDNPADARLIAEHLDDAARESGGMESDGRELNIVHAKSLNEATEFFRDGPFNIVLVDLTLPESSGMNTVRRAKALFEDCPLIVLTGYDDTRFALDALKLGAQDYLIKGHETGLSILRAILYALERQRMVNSIESSQRRYRSLIDSSPNAIYLLEDFRILLSNRAGLRLLGVEDEAALIGRCIFDFLDPETPREETRRQMEESAARETATPTERSYRMLTGRTVPVEDMVSRIAGDPNGPDQLLVVATDISEKKRIEDHLIHSRRMATMGELAAGIAHEISQPLNVIRIAAGMVADSIATKENDPEFVGERADKILAQVQRASKVINHLRTFVRKSESQPDFFDLNLAITQAFELMEQRLKLNGAHPQLQLADGLPPVRGDQNSLEQVVINLIANSLDAYEEMEVELKQKRGSCLLRVESKTESSATQTFSVLRFEDNGPGIPEEIRRQIFDPFFTTKKAGHGTGLGLSVCMNIIRDHRGTMKVTDTGQGTMFEIRLPAGSFKKSSKSKSQVTTPAGSTPTVETRITRDANNGQ